MPDTVKLYLKIFALASFPFGLWMGLADYGVSGRSLHATVVGVLAGIFFGGSMAVILVTMQFLGVVRLGFQITRSSLRVRQEATLCINRPMQDAFDACLDAVCRLPK